MVVEHIAGIIGDPSSWTLRTESGELVVVDLPGGHGAKIKMRKSEAIAKGLWKEPEKKAEEKAQPQARNKARRPTANKGRE
jgi:hypothetical protein